MPTRFGLLTQYMRLLIALLQSLAIIRATLAKQFDQQLMYKLLLLMYHLYVAMYIELHTFGPILGYADRMKLFMPCMLDLNKH